MIKKELETSLVLPVTPAFVERRICLVRGHKVMLDSDLAELYQVPTMRLNEQVKRNMIRFPADFMFQLTKEEHSGLISQIAISNTGRGGRRTLPYVFTELGVAMLSSVLKSDRAVQMNIFIMRAFVKLREMLATHKELAEKIERLEREQKVQGKGLDSVYSILKRLMDAPIKETEKIGFML